MRDLAAAVEQEGGAAAAARGLRARRAAVHRARLHDEVVVGPVEGVGQQRLDPGADRIAFHVAGDDAQFAGNDVGRGVEPGDERAGRHHGLEAGQLGGVGAPPRHLVEEVDELRRHRHRGQLEAPLQHREIGVEALARQQRAARRAGDADDALDAQALRLRLLEKRAQDAALVGVGVGGEQGQHFAREGAAAAGARQHFGDEAAARVREQVQAGAGRGSANERQGVGDRAGAEGRVVEAVDAVAVTREDLANNGVVLRPELREGAGGLGEGAVHEHQQRPAIGRGRHRIEPAAAALERLEGVGSEAVRAGLDLAIELLRHRRGGERHCRILGEARQHLEAGEQRLPHPAARGATRRFGFEAGPAELRRHRDLDRRAGRRRRAARDRAALREQQVAGVFGMEHQRRPVGDGEDDDIFARPRRHAHRLAAAAHAADAHRCLDPAARRGGRRRRDGLAGDDEDDVACHAGRPLAG